MLLRLIDSSTTDSSTTGRMSPLVHNSWMPLKNFSRFAAKRDSVALMKCVVGFGYDGSAEGVSPDFSTSSISMIVFPLATFYGR
jgi:hypothetical protein